MSFSCRDSNRTLDIFDEKKHPLTVSWGFWSDREHLPFALCRLTNDSLPNSGIRFQTTTPWWTPNTNSSTASYERSSARRSSLLSAPSSLWWVYSRFRPSNLHHFHIYCNPEMMQTLHKGAACEKATVQSHFPCKLPCTKSIQWPLLARIIHSNWVCLWHFF